MHIPDSAAKILTYILAWYALFLVISGTVLNLFASVVCFRLNKVSTFKILSVLFIFEVVSLYTWNLDIFLKWFMPFKGNSQTINEYNVIESLSLATCKIFTFMQFYSLQCISWLMAYVSFDHAIKLFFPRIFYVLHPNRFVYKICFFIAFIFFLVNLHIILFNGKISFTKNNITDALNITTEIEVMSFECYNTNFYQFFPFWDRIHLFLYAFVPFTLTIIANCLIIYKPYSINMQVNTATQHRKKRLTISILVTTFPFIVFVLPEIIAFGFFFGKLSGTNGGTLVLYLVDEFHFTFNAFIFILYYKNNTVFHKECKVLLLYILYIPQISCLRLFYKAGCVSRDTLDARIRDISQDRTIGGRTEGVSRLDDTDRAKNQDLELNFTKKILPR